MVNLRDALVSDALELTSEKSSSSVWVENPKFVEIIYSQNFTTSIPDASHDDPGLMLNSSGDNDDSLMSDTTICDASLSHAEYNTSLV